MTEHDGVGKYISLLFKIGAVMVSSISIFFSIGLMLIKWMNLPIGLLILFVFIGIGCGFYYTYNQIKVL